MGLRLDICCYRCNELVLEVVFTVVVIVVVLTARSKCFGKLKLLHVAKIKDMNEI